MAKRNNAYSGREILLQALDPLRRAHLEGVLEGLVIAGRIGKANPDYSGNLLAQQLQKEFEKVSEKLQIEAKASGGKSE